MTEGELVGRGKIVCGMRQHPSSTVDDGGIWARIDSETVEGRIDSSRREFDALRREREKGYGDGPTVANSLPATQQRSNYSKSSFIQVSRFVLRPRCVFLYVLDGGIRDVVGGGCWLYDGWRIRSRAWMSRRKATMEPKWG